MKKELTITISGTTGSGKTIVSALIHSLLRQKGFVHVNLENDSDFPNKRQYDKYVSKHLDTIVDKIKSEIKLNITQVQTQRLPTDTGLTDEQILKQFGWVIDCESPFNIRNETTNETIEGQSAHDYVDYLENKILNGESPDDPDNKYYGETEEPPYCRHCGGTDMSYIDQYANGEEWFCKECQQKQII